MVCPCSRPGSVLYCSLLTQLNSILYVSPTTANAESPPHAKAYAAAEEEAEAAAAFVADQRARDEMVV